MDEENNLKKTSSKERGFSVELNSKHNLKCFSLTNGNQDTVLIEGTIGELIQANFAEDIILEVRGKDGTLRVDLGKNEIKKPKEEVPIK